MRTTVCCFGALLLTLALATGACGSDLSTDAQSPFNDFEANQVLNAAASVIEVVDATGPGFAASTESVSMTLDCNLAGTALVAGTRDPGPAIDLDARVTYTSCANFSVTLNGVIDVTATSSAPGAAATTVTWTYLGTLQSRKDGRLRTCTMDVTRVKSTTNGATTLTTTGNLCNRMMS